MSKDNAERYPLLRTALRAIGLSGEKIDQVIQFIVEILDEREERGPDIGAFRLRDDFLSPAEKSFFLVLRQVVASDGEVLAKIRLGDLFYACRGDYGDRVGLRNRVDRKHVDFLVCHPTNFEPWFGVELDDSTHQRSDRKERDVLVDEIFAAANLPLVRVPVRSSYNPKDLEQHLRESTNFRAGTTSVPVPTKPQTIPNATGQPNAMAATGKSRKASALLRRLRLVQNVERRCCCARHGQVPILATVSGDAETILDVEACCRWSSQQTERPR